MGLLSYTSLGIDITPTALRVVGVKMGRKVSFLGCKELPLASGSTPEPADMAKLLHQALTGAAPHKLPSASAVLSIPESEVFRKVLELPVLASQQELSDAIKVEVASYLPQDASEMELDYQNLGLLPDEKTQQIMVVAVAKQTIARYLEICRLAKVPLRAIDVSAAALSRSTVAPSEPKAVAVVTILANSSVVSLSQGGAVRVTSSLNQGTEKDGAELTEAQEKNLVNNLVDEVDHVLKFYNNRTASHSEILEVRVMGRGPVLKPLQEAIRKQVDLPVSLAKPIIEVPAFCDQRFMAALGCALYPKGEQV
jgi:type IV pilus assembly protein PilM